MEGITEYADFGDNSDYFFYLKGYGAGIRLGKGTTKGTGYG